MDSNYKHLEKCLKIAFDNILIQDKSIKKLIAENNEKAKSMEEVAGKLKEIGNFLTVIKSLDKEIQEFKDL